MVRSKEILMAGVHHETLSRMKRDGEVRQIARGVYVSSGLQLPAEYELALVAARSHAAVVCLLSALHFHDIGTQLPRGIWIAVPRGQRVPRMDELPVNAVRYSGRSFTSGIEKHIIAGIQVKIYSPAKTVADCFKHRNKIGFDVALEALRDVWRRRLCTADELWKYAAICRVNNVMRPYLESLA